jgi:hypothetical protein
VELSGVLFCSLPSPPLPSPPLPSLLHSSHVSFPHYVTLQIDAVLTGESLNPQGTTSLGVSVCLCISCTFDAQSHMNSTPALALTFTQNSSHIHALTYTQNSSHSHTHRTARTHTHTDQLALTHTQISSHSHTQNSLHTHALITPTRTERLLLCRNAGAEFANRYTLC